MQLNSEDASTGAKLLNDAGLPANDSALCSAFWDSRARLRAQLSKKAQRNPDEAAANEFIHQTERELRDRFLATHIGTFHDKLTNCGSKFLRVEQLVLEAAQIVPGLAPSAEALALERGLLLKDKEGLEIDHGIPCPTFLRIRSLAVICAMRCFSLAQKRSICLSILRNTGLSISAPPLSAKLERRLWLNSVTLKR